MNLELLKAPFPEDQIEWRIGQCGKKGNGHVWAMCLAYVQARAVMDRLDEACGVDNWDVRYRILKEDGLQSGIIATIGIYMGSQWVYKEDGAEQTDIESFKGGLSSALKRAGSAWGIGRYLYDLEAGFAQISERGVEGAKWAKTKDGHEFHWLPPRLPQWALPSGHKAVVIPHVTPGTVHPNDGAKGFTPEYRIPFGNFSGRALEEIDVKQLGGYVNYLHDKAKKKGIPLSGKVLDFVNRATEYIGALENQPLEPEQDSETVPF